MNCSHKVVCTPNSGRPRYYRRHRNGRKTSVKTRLMKIGRRLKRILLHRLLTKDPQLLFKELDQGLLSAIVMQLNRSNLFDPEALRPPATTNGFEDLAFLFWTNPLNRGLIRMDLDEAAALFRSVSALSQPVGVEIGRYWGGSTLLLALAVGSEGRIQSIDIAPQNDAWLSTTLNEFGLLDRVELQVTSSENAGSEDGLDFVLVDGNHCYEAAKGDHNIWGKRLKVGGLLIHHDMGNARPHSTQWPDLARLRQEVLSRQAGELKLQQEVGSLTIFERVSSSWTDV